MLWKGDNVPLTVMNLQGPKRSFFRMPHIVTIASGPGRIAVQPRRDRRDRRPAAPSRDGDGRARARLPPRQRARLVQLRAHQRASPTSSTAATGCGSTASSPARPRGSSSSTATATCSSGRSPPARASRSSRARCSTRTRASRCRPRHIKLTSGIFGGTSMYLARMTGPGRVGIQSMYHHHESGE